MMPRLFRHKTFGLLICALTAWIAFTTTFSISHGATPNGLPLPIELPVPQEVVFSDGFADSMAIDGDFVAVGAPNTTVSGHEKQGLVYIYRRNSNDPSAFTLLKQISGSDSAAHDMFGWSVAMHGDTLVAGNGTNTNNAAYIFARNQGGENNWGEVKKLVRGDSHTFTHFGRSVAIHGDTILVGAPLGLGEVFVFQRDQDGADQWGKRQILDAGLPITSSIKVAAFGESIAFDGEKVVISAPNLGLTAADVPAGSPTLPQNFAGAVFVYHQENGQWISEAKLFSSDIDLDEDPLLDDRFGASLMLNGDSLFIGATSGRTNGVAAGKVFVYQQGSGATPLYGQSGGWGEIVQLSPSDGVGDDRFGAALYAVDDALFAGAEKQGIGKVYVFRNLAGAANSAMPQALQGWGEIYSFNTGPDGSSTAFGAPLAGSGNSVLIGDHKANEGRGGIFAYAKDSLFAYDPNTTPTPSPTPPTPTPPPGAEPCVSGKQAQQTQLYLPAIVGRAAQANTNLSIAMPQAVTALFTGILAPGCVVTGPGGVKVAAVEGAITQTLALTIAVTSAPAEGLPDGATPVGDFYRISAAGDKHVQMQTPFVVAIPAPANVDSSHLVIALLLPAAATLDSKATGKSWGYLPGVYDAATHLFLAQMPFLLADGTTLTLVEHPDFVSPANQPPSSVQSASTDVRGEFSVYCIHTTFAHASDCTTTMESAAKSMLDEIYQRMTDKQIFGFPRELRLLNSNANFIVSESITTTALTASYSAYILGPKSSHCTGAAGFYTVETGFLGLCVSAGNAINGEEKQTLIHEFFHAVEFTYPAVLFDSDFVYIEQPWIVEGMAEASVYSYPLTKMQRSPYFGENNLQNVDEKLTKGVAGDGVDDEYLAQDFWVYAGLSEGQSLAYLGPLLSIGGAHRAGIDYALKTIYNKSLSDFYWGWVKHQSIENVYDVGAGPGVLCELSEEALSTGAPVGFPASEQFYPFDGASAFDTLPPLTAKVIEVNFVNRSSATVMVEYQGCAGLQDAPAKASCVAAAQQHLKVKIYEEGEFNCQKDELPGVDAEGIRHLTAISPDLRYFVVVANIDADQEHGYFIAIE